MCAFVHVCTCICLWFCGCLYVDVCMSVFMNVYILECQFVSVHVCIHAHLCACVCVSEGCQEKNKRSNIRRGIGSDRQ